MKNSKRYKLRSYILLLLVCCTLSAWSQKDKSGTFLFQGVVYGYHHDPSRKFLQKSKQFVIEGLLSGAQINVYDKDNFLIDTRSIPKEKSDKGISFTGAEFMLNSFKIKEEADPDPIGRLYY